MQRAPSLPSLSPPDAHQTKHWKIEISSPRTCFHKRSKMSAIQNPLSSKDVDLSDIEELSPQQLAQVVSVYQQLRQEISALGQKQAELEVEKNEHK